MVRRKNFVRWWMALAIALVIEESKGAATPSFSSTSKSKKRPVRAKKKIVVNEDRQCPECAKIFASPSYLSVHMRIHTKEKPFTCEECGVSFTRNATLIVHRRVHFPALRVACPVEGCTCTFLAQNHMRYHVKKKHGQAMFDALGLPFYSSGGKSIVPVFTIASDDKNEQQQQEVVLPKAEEVSFEAVFLSTQFLDAEDDDADILALL